MFARLSLATHRLRASGELHAILEEEILALTRTILEQFPECIEPIALRE
jgi:hypothetical protein